MRTLRFCGNLGLVMGLSACLFGQASPAPVSEMKGIPPRAAPTDYQAHVEAGPVTLAAEFTGHAFPTAEGPLENEEYVAVEAALFGPAGTKVKLSFDNFSLRINDKKTPLESRPYAVVVRTLTDPEWVPPEPPAAKSKGGLSTGGKGDEGNSAPVKPKIPIAVQRAMAQRVQKASMPEGERELPQAGLLFFQYRGKSQGIHSVELIYTGPDGKATTLTLQP